MLGRGRRIVNLALQGGGSHGAFTWGVLDRLLEDDRLAVEGMSGTSAGAMNAVVLAHGLLEGGRDGARAALRSFWDAIATRVAFPGTAGLAGGYGLAASGELSPLARTLLSFCRAFSPYQLNPFDINPLRDIVERQIDFERLRVASPVKLFVATTHVRTGRLRMFATHELSADVVLASACLPSLYQGIEIDGELYWDGGYAGNPAVFPLLHECRSHDVIVVLIHPLERPSAPKTAKAILNRVTELGFGAAFLREMRAIAFAKQTAENDLLSWGRLERRLRRVRFSIIEAEELMSELSSESTVNTHHAFLDMLYQKGRERARLWIEKNVRRWRPPVPVDLAEVFG